MSERALVAVIANKLYDESIAGSGRDKPPWLALPADVRDGWHRLSAVAVAHVRAYDASLRSRSGTGTESQ